MSVDNQEPATWTVHEAAHILGIGRNLAYELAKGRKLPGALYLGGRIVVSRKMLEQYLNGAEPQSLEGGI
jgi:excisionase family DNA binding protein